MRIQQARKADAPAITQLIMTAMTPDCCLYYVGPNHTLDDFRRVMQALVERDDTQYSYVNALVALDGKGEVLGTIVCYDGALLHQLREPFIQAALSEFQQDHSAMDDETEAGEIYIDSLAVFPQYRNQGIASQLLQAAIQQARDNKAPAIGLLVDKGNPNAERLYTKLGFEYRNDATWGGHPMKHLQIKTS